MSRVHLSLLKIVFHKKASSSLYNSQVLFPVTSISFAVEQSFTAVSTLRCVKLSISSAFKDQSSTKSINSLLNGGCSF